ncbi:MAG: efflux RND transporter permease subunit [Bacteroidetes bacterium]|nr:efflux RND transporter permease subunit [Bacteroidota bacterium]
MRNIVAYFIKYPVAVNVALIAIVLFGMAGLWNTKSSFFPLNESRIITIRVSYPGASPEEMEEGIVLKIEDNLKGLVGIDRVTSTSSENTATITVETLKDYDIDVVLANVKNAVDRVPSYPSGMDPPVIAKVETRNEAISFTISGDEVPLITLKQIARNIEYDIRAMEGISQVGISGFPAEEIEIALREKDMRAYNLTFEEVARAVGSANIITTGGTVKTPTEEYLIRAKNRSYYGDELDHIVVRADPSGNTILLKDIAEVRDRWNENPDRLYFNRNSAIQVRVQSTNNEDLISNADKVVEYIDDFNERYDNVRLDITRDASITLKERTQLLVENGGLGILLVLILLSLFLKPSLAFWVAVGLPVSLFGMFIFAPSLNVTINVLSLFGLIIVIGILVDDAIVIGENIYHHYEKGKSPIRAAIDGTMEVLPPVVSAILTTIIAFSTFFFLEGRIGEFFSQVSTVVLLTLSISLVEALIILPSHIAHSRALTSNKKPFIWNYYGDKFMFWMRDKVYGPVLHFFLTNKFLGFAIPLAMLVITIGAVGGGVIRSTFFPNIASDRVTITLRMPQGTSETVTDSIITLIETAAWEVNEDFTERQNNGLEVLRNTIKRIGPGTANATVTLNLLPGEQRAFPSSDIANAVQETVGPIFGVESLEFGSGRNFGGKPVSVSLVSNNIAELKEAKEALKERLQDNQLLKDISDNDPAGIKEIKLELKESAYLLGMDLNSVMSQVRSGFFGRQIQRFQRGQDEIRVWVRFDREDRESIKSMDDMWIVTPSRNRVPLSEIANYSIERGEIAINHLNGQREIKVEANLKDLKESATDILDDIRLNVFPRVQAQYPSVSALYEGQNREASKVSNSASKVLPVILFLIYAIIAFVFRSYSQPLLLFIMVPFSLIGVAWGHWIHGFPINMLSWLGIIALIGIMVNDGLVLIGKFNIYLKEGMPFEEALFEAGKSRFRAIFLTSLTTIAGLSPLIFETSRQAQFLIPMAISIAYGIFIATFLTLLMLPLLLSVSNSVKVGKKWLFTGKKPSKEEVERAIIEQKVEQDELAEI